MLCEIHQLESDILESNSKISSNTYELVNSDYSFFFIKDNRLIFRNILKWKIMIRTLQKNPKTTSARSFKI